MKGDPRRVADATKQLEVALAAFIDRAHKGDVKGMLERGVMVTEQLQRVTEIVTGTGIAG